jgi:hypothetical protein
MPQAFKMRVENTGIFHLLKAFQGFFTEVVMSTTRNDGVPCRNVSKSGTVQALPVIDSVQCVTLGSTCPQAHYPAHHLSQETLAFSARRVFLLLSQEIARCHKRLGPQM